MGLLDDLKMGLGLKERDDDYYERTARTLGRTQGAAREAAYRQSNVFKNKPARGGPAGLLSSAFGDRSTRSQYRDINDMFDGGGPMASGGRFQGGGLLSLLANLLMGGDMGERKPYEAQGQVKISSTTGEIPKSTRDAIGALRPILRPDNLNVPGAAMPTQIGNSGMGMDVPSYSTMPPQVGNSGMGMAGMQPPAPAPGVPEMGVPAMGGATDIASMRNELANAGIDTTYMPNDLIPDFYNTYLSVNR